MLQVLALSRFQLQTSMAIKHPVSNFSLLMWFAVISFQETYLVVRPRTKTLPNVAACVLRLRAETSISICLLIFESWYRICFGLGSSLIFYTSGCNSVSFAPATPSSDFSFFGKVTAMATQKNAHIVQNILERRKMLNANA